MSITFGPTPTSECLRLFRELAPQVASGYYQARLDDDVAWVLAARCAFTESRALLVSSRAVYREFGLRIDEAALAQILYDIENMAGDASAAIDELLAAAATLEAIEETSLLSSVAGMLADAFVVKGMNEEAHEFSHKAERLADPDDVDAQTRWRRARARVLVRRGDAENAEALARAAVGLVAHSDALNNHAARCSTSPRSCACPDARNRDGQSSPRRSRCTTARRTWR